MNVSIISFTDRGRSVSRRIARSLPNACVTQYAKAEGFVPYESVGAFARQAMETADAIVFVGAAGIAVRAIAPYVRGKDVDPAVLVTDENGRFVISLLSGHIGGANRLTQALAQELHAIPVITTATDGRGMFAVDSWAVGHGCTVRNTGCIKYISSALLCGETVGLQCDFPISGTLPDGVTTEQTPECGIQISVFVQDNVAFAHTLRLVPRIVHVGVGCRRGTPPEKLSDWISQILQDMRLDAHAIASVASIDLKADEPAVLQLAQAWRVPTRFYSARELEQVSGAFPPSDFVRRTTGTDNVCQRAAARASGEGRCLLAKTAHDGMTVSIYCEDWRAAF